MYSMQCFAFLLLSLLEGLDAIGLFEEFVSHWTCVLKGGYWVGHDDEAMKGSDSETGKFVA